MVEVSHMDNLVRDRMHGRLRHASHPRKGGWVPSAAWLICAYVHSHGPSIPVRYSRFGRGARQRVVLAAAVARGPARHDKLNSEIPKELALPSRGLILLCTGATSTSTL